MAQVKFYRGLASTYTQSATTNPTIKEGIYFSMDEKVIYHNGVKFGGIDPQYFSGVTKDFDIEGNIVSFKKLDNKGSWKDVSIQLVKASDSSVEIGTITNAEGTVNDGFTVKVKADYAAADKDGLKLDDSKGLYVDLTHTTAAIAANTAKIATNKNAIDANTAAIDTLNGADTVNGSVAKSIKDAIGNINTAVTINANQVITAITQTDGKVTASTTDLTAKNVNATPSTGVPTAVDVTGATVEAQIASLATSIKSVESGKTYTISAVTPSEENVKEAFALVDGGGRQAGATIKIYNDSSLVSLFVAKEVAEGGEITIGNKHYSRNTSGQTLIYEYLNANGETEYAAVDLSNFLLDSEYGDGLQTNGGRISVKIDTISSDSEGFLTVGENGVKLSGVQNAIDTTTNNKINTLTASIKGESDHVDVTVGQANGIITSVTVANEDIASAALLGKKEDASTAETAFGRIAKEVADREAAINGLKLDSVGGTGKVITTISQKDGKVSATEIDLTASNVSASEITSSNATVAVTGTKVSEQIASLAKSIKTVSTAAAAAHTKVDAKNDGHVRVSVAKSSDNTHDVVTIAENDIASATALTAETSSRVAQDDKIEAAVGLKADGSHLKASGHYTSGATTVVGEIEALDTQLFNVSNALEWIDCGEYGKA